MSTVRWSPTTAQRINRSSGSIVIGSPGSGKACWNDENIITPFGMKKIKDINIGDRLFGKDGKQTTVIGVFPQGKKQLYRVTLSDGRSLVCSGDHRFGIVTKSPKLKIMTVQELLDAPYKHGNYHHFAIQNNDLIEYPYREFKVHPYILGAFLGDGCKSSGQLEFSSENDEIPTKIAKLLSMQLGTEILPQNKKHNYNWQFYYVGKDRGTTHKLVYAKDIDPELVELLTNTYCHEKYIPDEYKYCDKAQRLQLIQGIMDTDGAIGPGPRYNIGYGSTSKRLAYDVVEVLRSLGNTWVNIKSSMREKDIRPFYGVRLACEEARKQDFFSLRRKLDRAKAATTVQKTWRRHYDQLKIQHIEKLNLIDDCTCFTVDADDHQFIAGDTVVTHNTFFMLNVCANCLGMGQRVVVIDPKNDFSKLLNVSHNVELVDINRIRPGALNPFTFLDRFDTSTLMTIIEIICGKLDKEDIIEITPIVKDFVTKFNRDNEYKDMQDVADYLFSRDNQSAQKVGTMLKTYEDNKYGPLLFTRETDVMPLRLSKTSSMVISLHGMNLPDYSKKPEDYDSNERFTSAIIYIITSKLLEILSTDNSIPTTFVCDEAHLLFGNREMSQIIDRFLVLGRSLNVAIVLASQGISHFPDGIAQYITSKFMFRSSIDEAQLFLEKFDTSKLDAANAIDINSVVSGTTKLETGQAFFIDSSGRNGFIQVISNYPVSVLTSNPFDKKREEREPHDG